MFCLPKFAAESFKSKLKDGTINPAKLSEMTSAERRAFFEDIVGKENAEQVNASFESKLILKDQQRGMINWAKTLTGIKPEVQRDMLSKVKRLDQVLEPKELDLFLEDLAAKRLGVRVSAEDAAKIVELSKAIDTAKEKMLPDHTFSTAEDKKAFGYAQVDFVDYVADLKIKAASRSLKEISQSVYKEPGRALSEFGGFTKSLKASLDDSALLNQGLPVLFADPKLWFKNSLTSFKDIWNTFGGKEVMREIRADIMSRPNALNGTYRKMKLGVGITEEAFPSQLPERIPIAGRAFKAAETAFTGFQYRNRADLADTYLRTLKEMGADTTDKTRLESWGKLINSMTGRGNLGPAEPAANAANNVFFSPRFFKSHLDVLLLHPLGGAGGDPFVRKTSGRTLLKMVVGISIIMTIASAFDKDSVELDPRSTHFGKIKIFGHWTDITGGAASIITLAARVFTLSSKSASTGVVNPLNSGKFGAQNGFDVVNDFFGNKLSPLAGILRDYLKGTDPNGNKATPLNEAMNLTVPIPITSFNDLNKDPNKGNVLGAMILNTIGLNVSAYTQTPNSLVAQDKPAVEEEVLQKYANGDEAGGKELAHSFNEKLKESIREDLIKKSPDIDPNDLDEKVDTKWKKDAIYLPSPSDVEKFKNGDKDVVSGTTSTGKPIIKKETAIPTEGVIGTVVTYARAIGVDPVTAFNDIFKGQSIREVRNDAIIVNRMSLAASEKVKADRGGNNPTMKLDHTIPLELGGNNEESNLALVPTEKWKSYSPVENYLGTALKEGRAKKKDVQAAILEFKNGTRTFAEIKKQFPEPD